MQRITVGICEYPSALKLTLYGLEEVFQLANRTCKEQGIDVAFEPVLIRDTAQFSEQCAIIILPPGLTSHDYLVPPPSLIEWLRCQHDNGAIISAACAGVFILAQVGVIGEREVTTHWALADSFRENYPDIQLNTDKILIDHSDVITAGGIMSWLDLAFELIAKFSSSSVVRQLGKTLVIDTAQREQRYYRQFTPSLAHGDRAVIAIQHQISQEFQQPLMVSQLAMQANMTERTMQRRFLKATGYNPSQYLQHIRVQKACEYLESTQHSFEWIANHVGYEDVSACRKVFTKIMGLTPKAFKQRFGV